MFLKFPYYITMDHVLSRPHARLPPPLLRSTFLESQQYRHDPPPQAAGLPRLPAEFFESPEISPSTLSVHSPPSLDMNHVSQQQWSIGVGAPLFSPSFKICRVPETRCEIEDRVPQPSGLPPFRSKPHRTREYIVQPELFLPLTIPPLLSLLPQTIETGVYLTDNRSLQLVSSPSPPPSAENGERSSFLKVNSFLCSGVLPQL